MSKDRDLNYDELHAYFSLMCKLLHEVAYELPDGELRDRVYIVITDMEVALDGH